jgi:hypothetical protein
MAALDPSALAVTSFETVSVGVEPVKYSDNCVSPLCMTEDKACTTPWCKDDAAPVGIAD